MKKWKGNGEEGKRNRRQGQMAAKRREENVDRGVNSKQM